MHRLFGMGLGLLVGINAVIFTAMIFSECRLTAAIAGERSAETPECREITARIIERETRISITSRPPAAVSFSRSRNWFNAGPSTPPRCCPRNSQSLPELVNGLLIGVRQAYHQRCRSAPQPQVAQSDGRRQRCPPAIVVT